MAIENSFVLSLNRAKFSFRLARLASNLKEVSAPDRRICQTCSALETGAALIMESECEKERKIDGASHFAPIALS